MAVGAFPRVTEQGTECIGEPFSHMVLEATGNSAIHIDLQRLIHEHLNQPCVAHHLPSDLLPLRGDLHAPS